MNRVLLVEDDHLTNQSLQASLEDAGFEVEAAFSGGDALAAILRQPPRCLVTDLNLGPCPGGFEVARCARVARPDVRVVFMSSTRPSNADLATVARSDFIAKPLRCQQIIDALNRGPRLEAA